MKIILNAFLKFILILFITFFIFFCAFIVFNYLPFLKISGEKAVFKDIFTSIISPSFYHALFNSFIISIFLYGIFVLNYEKQYLYLSFIIPVIFTSLCLFSVYYFLKPVPKTLLYYDVEDARIFFPEKSFFNYEERFPGEFRKTDFENKVLKQVYDKNDKSLLEKSYYFDYKTDRYIYRNNFFVNNKDRIMTILYKTGYFSDIKMYFDKVMKKSIKNAIIVHDSRIDFYETLYTDFIEDRIFISVPANNIASQNERYEFMKNETGEYIKLDSMTGRLFFGNAASISYNFIFYKNIFKKTFLWFSVSFLILSFCIIIFVGRFPFISMIFKFIFIVLFYAYFGFLFDFFSKNTTLLLPADLAMMKDWIFIGMIFIIGFILLLLRLVFFKKNSWQDL